MQTSGSCEPASAGKATGDTKAGADQEGGLFGGIKSMFKGGLIDMFTEPPSATAPGSPIARPKQELLLAKTKHEWSKRAKTNQAAAAAAVAALGKGDIFESMFAGITTFGQRASALLNTLDTNFDTMFAPEEPQPPVLGAKRKMGSAALDVGEPDATGMLSAVLGSPRSHNKRRRSRPTLKEAGAKHVGRLVCPLAATPIVRETLAAAAAASVTPGAAGAAGAQQHGGGELRGMMTEPVRLRVTAQLRMLKAQYAKALEDLQAANSRAERLAAENSQLRGALSSSEADPVNDAISAQLQALLADKSKWMEENMRLARENAGLRELLAYTAFQAAEADEGDDDNCYSDEDRVGIMQDLDGADDEGTRGATIEQQQPPGEPEVAGGAVASEANGPDSNTAAAAEDLAATASAASP